MKFYLTDKNEEREIEMKEWDKYGQHYGPDFFHDVEDNVPRMYPHTEDGAICLTSKDYNEIVEWWLDEVEAMNTRGRGEIADYSESTSGEIALFYD